jgi:hypothetical protein
VWLTKQRERLPLVAYGVVALLLGVGVLFFITWAEHPSADPTLAFVLGAICLTAAIGLPMRNPIAYTLTICLLLAVTTAIGLTVLLWLLPDLFAATYLPLQTLWWLAGITIVLAIYAKWRDRGELSQLYGRGVPLIRALIAGLALVGVLEVFGAAVLRINEFATLAHLEITVPWGFVDDGFSRPTALQWAAFGIPVLSALAWSAWSLLRESIRTIFVTSGKDAEPAHQLRHSKEILAFITSDSTVRFLVILSPLVTASLVGSIPRDTWRACIPCGPLWHFVLGIVGQVLCYAGFAVLLWLNRSSLRTSLLHGSTSDLLIWSASCSNAALLINLEMTGAFWLDIKGDITWHIVALTIELALFVAVAVVVTRRRAPIWTLAPLVAGIPDILFAANALTMGWYSFDSSPREGECLVVFAGLHAQRAFVVNFLVQVIVAVHDSLRTRVSLVYTSGALLLAGIIAWNVFGSTFEQLYMVADIHCTAQTMGVGSWLNYLWP